MTSLATKTVIQPINARAGALWAIRRGFRVMRVKHDDKTPYGDGVNEATSDEATINRWFAAEPALNYGIAMGGPDKLVALDCDAKHASYPADYLGLCHPPTLELTSGSGGTHLVFSADFDAGQKDLAGATSINVRAQGGYIVGPGSRIKGRVYTIYDDAPIARCPPEIAARISRRGEKVADTPATPLCEPDTAAAMAATWALVARSKPAVEGERNRTAHALAGKLKRLGVSEETCAEMVSQWNTGNLPPLPDDEVRKTVASSYANGDWRIGEDRPDGEFDDLSNDPDLVEWDRRRAKRPEGTPAPGVISATPYVWADPSGILPRDWLLGKHLIRKFVSATVAPGGIGKSSLVLVEALSIVTRLRLLYDRAPRPGRVWYFNGEDPYDELQRRIQAICLHYGITHADIEGRFFVDTGRVTPIVIATETKHGATIAEPVVDAVKRTIRENGIDVFIVDPFVSCHRVAENDNSKIEAVAWEWAKIADECDCAVELVHHSRKANGAEVTADHSRGASSLSGKTRSVRVLNRMTDEEGEGAGVDNYRLYFRVNDGKGNMSKPSGAAEWYRLESVALGNGTGQRPQDEVGVVTAWTQPDPFEGLPDDALARAQAAIAEGQWRADPQADDWAGYGVAKALGLDCDPLGPPFNKGRLKTIMETWIYQGAFEIYEAKDRHSKTKDFIRPANQVQKTSCPQAEPAPPAPDFRGGAGVPETT
jgi:hypothetical protein